MLGLCAELFTAIFALQTTIRSVFQPEAGSKYCSLIVSYTSTLCRLYILALIMLNGVFENEYWAPFISETELSFNAF